MADPHHSPETQHDNWEPVWILPNVTLMESIDHSHVGLMHREDQRVLAACKLHPGLTKLVRAFKSEFGSPVSPTVLMMRSDAPPSVKTVSALGGFRDIVCTGAIVDSHARMLAWKRPVGIMFSDAFDIYPWGLGKPSSQHVYAFTPGLSGVHDLNRLAASPAAALPARSLAIDELDGVLVHRLMKCWDEYHCAGTEEVQHRKMFRALDSARFAARMPGGTDANIFDAGRSVALWVSAFEILAHDGKRADLERVLGLFSKVDWQHAHLQGQSQTIAFGKKTIPTNLAGQIYKSLYDARNAFLHGNHVNSESLRKPFGRHLNWFAAPLFRLALTGFLELNFDKPAPDRQQSPQAFSEHWTEKWTFYRAQSRAEEAILMANKPLDDDDHEDD
jgi:hypothetical protein